MCADTGSDVNLIGPRDLAFLLASGADVKVTKFQTPRQYQMATDGDSNDNKIFVECDRAVKLDTRLHVRHAVGIMLRNCTWMVATQDVKEPLLGRHVLESLGLDIKQVLQAACDKFNGEVDMAKLLPADEAITGSVARICNEGIFHGHAASEEDASLSEDNSLFVSIGDDTPEEIDAAFRELLKEAQTEGMSDDGLKELSNILSEYRDIFRIRLGRDPPARVEPMQLNLKPDSKPINAKARRYSTPQRVFISTFTKKLEYYGFIKQNKNAKWAAAPLLVPKPPPVNYRLTFDYRPVNAATEAILWPMPHIESELSDTADSSAFAKLDFCYAYWQLPLGEDGQEALSFTTPNGIMKPIRTPQGGKNCASNFQAKVEPCFEEIRDNLKAWLDDFLIHCKDEHHLLRVLRIFFRICRERRLQVSALAHKTKLFKHKVRWCGRIISKVGVQFDPDRVSGLKDAHPPTTAAELCQYVHCLQWMSQAIPDISQRVASFRNVLEEAYKKSGKRTRRSIKNIKLADLSWGTEHVEIFHSLQEQLKEVITLAHRDPEKSICVFTDASDLHWAAVVTQCDPKELEKEVSEQHNEPLAFLSSSFKKSELNWSTFEKEAFAIYQTFKKLDYMFACEELIHIFTDHRILLFVYHPRALHPLLGRHIISKALRWGLFLARFLYIIEHVCGESNFMPDIMTRWYRGYRGNRKLKVRYIREVLEQEDIIRSVEYEGFEIPDISRIKVSQCRYREKRPQGSVYRDGIIYCKEKIWIPRDDVELQMAVLVATHAGVNGHRGKDATENNLKSSFYWDSMEQDCSYFVDACIHCILSQTGNKIPRPLATTCHGSRPNEVVHFGFFFAWAQVRMNKSTSWSSRMTYLRTRGSFVAFPLMQKQLRRLFVGG